MDLWLLADFELVKCAACGLEQANREGGCLLCGDQYATGVDLPERPIVAATRHHRQAQDVSLLRRIVCGLQLEFARTWRPQYVHLPAPRQLQPVKRAAIASSRRRSRSHAHASTAS
jgi:hypothetical protein